MKSKQEYEILINESCLFSIDKEKEQTSYHREQLKMIEYLYGYLMSTSEIKYENYAVEIVEVSKACIKNYDPAQGRFLNYFLSAWSREYRHIMSDELFESDYASIKFTDRQKRNYIRYKMSCSKLGIDINSKDFNQRISDDLGLSDEEVRELRLMDSLKAESIDDSFNSGESERPKQYPSDIDIADDYMHRDLSKRYLEEIGVVFSSIQNRQKLMISMLLTTYLALEIEDDEVLDCFKRTEYFNNEIYLDCIQRGISISNKEIADKLGVKEASLSRSWKMFKEKLRKLKI